MKNIHIENSYNTWAIIKMYSKITVRCWEQYKNINAAKTLNRSYAGMYIEWWLHNIGYYLTLPFVKNEKINAINKRFKDVDLEEHTKTLKCKF